MPRKMFGIIRTANVGLKNEVTRRIRRNLNVYVRRLASDGQERHHQRNPETWPFVACTWFIRVSVRTRYYFRRVIGNMYGVLDWERTRRVVEWTSHISRSKITRCTRVACVYCTQSPARLCALRERQKETAAYTLVVSAVYILGARHALRSAIRISRKDRNETYQSRAIVFHPLFGVEIWLCVIPFRYARPYVYYLGQCQSVKQSVRPARLKIVRARGVQWRARVCARARRIIYVLHVCGGAPLYLLGIWIEHSFFYCPTK